jgi:hypothetical protein
MDFVYRPMFSQKHNSKNWICLRLPSYLKTETDPSSETFKIALERNRFLDFVHLPLFSQQHNSKNWICLRLPSYLKTETDPVSETFMFLRKQWTMDKDNFTLDAVSFGP